jgi:hypothetical protein
VLSLFGIIAFWPPLARMRAHHWVTGAVIVLVTAGFYVMLFRSLSYAGAKYGPKFEWLEEQGPS